MEFIKDFITENSSTLTDSLSGAGFSAEQASRFLPEAASSISGVFNNSGMEQVIAGVASGGPSQILSSINIGEIASKLGMSSEQVTSGFESILPVVTNMISQKGGDIGGTFSSVMGGGAGDLIGAAKKLFD